MLPVLVQYVVGLVNKSDMDWYSCSVTCEGAAGVCLMDKLFAVTCAGAVAVVVMVQSDIETYSCLLLQTCRCNSYTLMNQRDGNVQLFAATDV